MHADAFTPISKGANAKLCANALDSDDDLSKTKDLLLKKAKNNRLLVETKYDELMSKFKDRDCLSCCDLWFEKEEDPRRCHTWPLQVSVEIDEQPLQPFTDYFPDNVYADGLTAEQLFMIRYL